VNWLVLYVVEFTTGQHQLNVAALLEVIDRGDRTARPDQRTHLG
jgi:hypothetical protein